MIHAGISDSVASVLTPPTECPFCQTQARVNGGECLSCLLRAGVDDVLPNETCQLDQILAEIDVRDTDWRLGNYQILEEIGRGGMGVIYRARQRHSKRIVALKRVLSYHGDSRETLERFRREAEAAASLDHPNILPIYEVGEADGLPFFTMKYATGGTLQEAAPALHKNPRESVRLMAKITRAVAYAHRQGILHRDLKPGNILLDGRGEPMVSDFGLAKWIDVQSDLTRSLAIFGTPGFIAPEQATGDRAKLTPAADVYSLGAILFDLLGSRPPFLGEHALAVIRQAAEKPALKLRTLNHSLGKDLETICSKCLEREPDLRYRSASDLAEDLERWLEGRSIVARPVLPPIRAWRWSRRNPKLAGSIAACAVLSSMAAVWQIERSQLATTVAQEQLASRSVIVLPFLNLDTAQPDESMAIAMAQELQAHLGRFGAARVTPVTQRSLEWAGTGDVEDMAEANREVKARAVLTGTERNVGGTLRVSVRLMDAASGSILFTKLVELESGSSPVAKIARGVTTSLRSILDEKNWAKIGPLARDPGMRNPAAREFIISGRQLMFRGTIEDYDASIRCLERSLQIEPNSAIAHAYLSATQSARVHFVPDAALLESSEREVREALRLEPLSLEGHRALAGVLFQKNDLRAVLEEQLRAIEAGGPEEHLTRFLGTVLLMLGQPHQAVRWLEIVKHRTPVPGNVYARIGECWQILGDDAKAEAAFQRGMELSPEQPGALVGLCYLRLLRNDIAGARNLFAESRTRLQNYQKVFSDNSAKEMIARIELVGRNYSNAERLYSELLENSSNKTTETYGAMSYSSALGRIRQALGDEPGSRALLEEELAREMASNAKASAAEPLYRIAAIEASLGDSDAAIKNLDAAVAVGWLDFRSLQIDPRFDSLKGDARFHEIISALTNRASELRRQTGQPLTMASDGDLRSR